MNKTSIFVAIAPNHISNFECIIANKLHRGKTILINPGQFTYDKSLWEKVVVGNMNLQYTASTKTSKFLYQLNKIRGYKLFIDMLKKQVSFDHEIEFFYCNLDDVLTNHLYTTINKTQTQINYVVEDGILNYYSPEISINSLKKKKLLSKIFGLTFRPILSHPTNINSEKVKAQFVRIPSSSICPDKSIKLPFSPIVFSPIPKNVLIIGQDIMHNFGEGEQYYIQRIKRLFEIIAHKHKDAKVIYKPHRNGNSSIAEKILTKQFTDVTIYRDVTPIESCIVKLRPSSIYSFESSAMLNLKMAVKDKNINFAFLPYQTQSNSILDLYTKLGIKKLE